MHRLRKVVKRGMCYDDHMNIRKLITASAMIALCGALVGGVTATTTAHASIPDVSGDITACYRPSGPGQGQLHVIDGDTDVCPTGFSTLEWSTRVSAATLGREVVEVTNTSSPINVTCPAGKVAVSGGVRWNGLGVASVSSMHVVSSYPTSTGWFLLWQNTASNVTTDAFAVCVNA